MKKYDAYKDSGIDVIGEIPSHWDVTKVKYIGTTIPGGTPSTEREDFWEGGEIPWLPSGKIQNCDIENADKFITQKGLENSATKWINPGSVLIALTGATCANVAYLKFAATANQSVVAIHENKNINSRFLFFLMLSQREQILTHKAGGAQSGINEGDVKNIFLVTTSIDEQTEIANYLDNKTSEIDTVIQQKQNLLDKLQLKRQAIINEAVTKGVNSDVEMKDSGIQWIGEIPKHWEVKKLKYLVHLNNNEISFIPSDKIFKVALENIEGFTGKYKSSDENGEFEGIGNSFQKGDVLFNKLRPYLSKVYLAEQDGLSVGELLVLSPQNNIESKFLFYRLLSSSFIAIVNSSTYGAKMPRANWDFIGNTKIGFPRKQEQTRIVHFLEHKIAQLSELENKLKIQINKLEIYRQSLISEVVTGKVKVI